MVAVKSDQLTEIVDAHILEAVRHGTRMKLHNIDFMVNQKSDVKRAGGVTTRWVRGRLQALARKGKVKFVDRAYWAIVDTDQQNNNVQGAQA